MVWAAILTESKTGNSFESKYFFFYFLENEMIKDRIFSTSLFIYFILFFSQIGKRIFRITESGFGIREPFGIENGIKREHMNTWLYFIWRLVKTNKIRKGLMKASTTNEKKSSDVGQKGKLCRCNGSLQMTWVFTDVMGLCR